MGMLAIVAIARFEETQSQLAKSSTGSLFFGILSLGWVANFCAILIVFTGVRGVTSIKQNAKYYEQGKACVKNLPTPFYVDEFYLSLPWVNPSRPIIYPGYNYGFQRSKGYRFERGGIGGMISAGHFKALVLKGVVKEYDGADLSNFTLGPQCKDLQVYLYIPKTQ